MRYNDDTTYNDETTSKLIRCVTEQQSCLMAEKRHER